MLDLLLGNLSFEFVGRTAKVGENAMMLWTGGEDTNHRVRAVVEWNIYNGLATLRRWSRKYLAYTNGERLKVDV